MVPCACRLDSIVDVDVLPNNDAIASAGQTPLCKLQAYSTYKLNPSWANERVGTLVQDLDLVLKGTICLLTPKRVRVRHSVLYLMFLAIHPVLPLKWEAYWASADELPSPIQI